ncbi:MAG: hypothetical protein ACPL5F_04960 [Moorellaceae bacterium]
MKKVEKVNDWIAVKATLLFGTMWTTYLFFLYGFLPLIWPQYMVQIMYWSSTVQLWALPLLMVGTNLLGKSSERRAQKDHEMIMAQFKQINELIAAVKQDLQMQQDEMQEIKAIIESLTQIQQQLEKAEGTD